MFGKALEALISGLIDAVAAGEMTADEAKGRLVEVGGVITEHGSDAVAERIRKKLAPDSPPGNG